MSSIDFEKLGELSKGLLKISERLVSELVYGLQASQSVMPLYGSLYSTVSKAVSRRGIWVMGRGGDRNEIFGHLLDKKLRFLIRIVGCRRHLEVGDKGKTPFRD
ncbi:MAG: hypothetical protein ACE5GV_00535 [Candidatus Scalindua sp.]